MRNFTRHVHDSSKSKGFTLVETLVAVAILVLGVSAAFSSAGASLSTASFSKDQIVAIYLAQEGVEVIRNKRDSNALENRSWLTGISSGSSPCAFNAVCRVDAVTGNLQRCGTGSCAPVRQDPVTGFFGHDTSWPRTKFTREVRMTSVNDHEASILVTVSWTRGPITRTFNVRENILDWQ